MPYDKNEPEYAGGPKKADIIIKNTHELALRQQDLAMRQQELAEQTKLAVSKMEDIIKLFNDSNAESSDAATRNGEIFTQLQGENSALKQELLYLAKQSENIYAGLAEKITELSDQAKVREDAMTGFADRLNDVAEQTRKGEESYSIIADKLTELAEQSKRSTELYNELSNRLDVISTFTQGAYVPASEKVESKVDLSEVLDRIEALSAKVGNVQRVEQQPVVLQTGQPAIVDLSQVMTRLDTLSDQMKKNERACGELADRVSERKPAPRGDYSDADIGEIFDKLTRISEQLRRGESAHSMLADKFEILSMRVDQYAYDSKGASSYRPQPQVIAQPQVIPAPVQTVVKEEKELDYDKLAQKVADLLSAREAVSPDYIASKVAEQIVIPEVDIPSLNVSMDADYIASKVAEKIVIPSFETPNVNVTVDEDYIAKQVAEKIVLPEPAPAESVQAPVFDEEGLVEKIAKRVTELQPELTIDEDGLAEKITQRVKEVMPAEEIQATADVDSDELAEKIAQRLNLTEAQKELAPASAVEINEESLAERLAGKLGVYTSQVLAPSVSVSSSGIDEEGLAQRIADKLSGARASAYDVDEEELADAISLKVGSLKAEDFEILVDDEGCSSISKGIAENLDYNMISNIIGDKLREALDLAAVNAPDYEEMAERISEKITVAGINEDAIADKAAAVLSNYLPEFDTEEIADKVTGAVIDVVSAIPTPTVDSDEICNTITERLIESQEDHDYDIVLDDDGIARITELVSEEVTKDTDARFDKVEENIAKLSEMLSRIDENTTAQQAEPAEEEDPLADVVSRLDGIEENITKLTSLMEAPEDEETYDEQYDETEDDYDAISEMVSRLDGIEENITKLTELMTPEEEEYEETEEEVEEAEETEESGLAETVVSEIEKVGTRLAGVEENIAKIAEYLASETQEDEEEPEEVEGEEEDYTSEVVSRLTGIEENVAKLTELLTPEEVEEEQAQEAEDDGYDALSEVVTRLDGIEENITKLNELLTSEEEYTEEEYAEEDYTVLSETVAGEVEKRISCRLDSMEERISAITDVVRSGAEEEASQFSEAKLTNLSLIVAAEVQRGINAKLDDIEASIADLTQTVNAEDEVPEYEEYEVLDDAEDNSAISQAIAQELAGRFDVIEESIAKLNESVAAGHSEEAYTALSEAVANEVEKRVSPRFDAVEESVSRINEAVTPEEVEAEDEEDYTALSEAVADEVEKRVNTRLEGLEESVAKINEAITAEPEYEEGEEEYAEGEEIDYTALSEAVANEVEKRVNTRLEGLEESVAKINEVITAEPEYEEGEEEYAEGEEIDYTALSEAVANEVEKRVNTRLEGLEESVAKINEAITAEPEYEEGEEEYAEGEEIDYTALSEAVANEVEKRVNTRLEGLEESVAKINEAITAEPEYEEGEEENAEGEEIDYTALSEAVANEVEKRVNSRLAGVEEKVSAILANGIAVSEVAAAQPVQAEELPEEEPLVTVSDIVDADETEEEAEEIKEEAEEVKEVEETAPLKAEAAAPLKTAEEFPEDEEFEEEEEEEEDEDFLIDVLDMDAFSDDELMPGEGSEFRDGVDFENMMKFKRSFIARIIQSNDDYKQYYGEVKHALLSYRKVNSNVAWGAERFNKGRETIARMKIRGKTLCLYLALDPNEYKTSVYHHLDVSDNKSVAGTPMMVKVKSNLGVRKAIRLIDEMLAKRNGEKREIPERDYAAMYPYETIEELIEEGLVKDVRKK